MKKVSQFIANNKTNRIDLSTDPVYNDKKVQEFIKLENISKDLFLNQYKTFYDFYIMNSNPGIFNINPFLVNMNSTIEIKYNESEDVRIYRESRKLKNVVKTAYVANSILKFNFINMNKDNKVKTELAKKLIKSVDEYLVGKTTRGMYIYGKTGIGKTYMMGSLYNYLKSNGKEPAIIYFPEFLRKVKSEINSGRYYDIIDEIREQEILIIDDFGSENLTDFLRDEVILPIINYRSDEKLLTYFTSNLGLSELKSFLENTKESKDETKAIRILRRITDLADVEYLDV